MHQFHIYPSNENNAVLYDYFHYFAAEVHEEFPGEYAYVLGSAFQ